MCFGGGGGGTIQMPDTGAYDAMANAQIGAMQSAMSMGIQQTQNTLNQALSHQQTVAAELRDVQIQRAENTAAQAKRLADLIGTPPPEETAKAPRTNEKQDRTNKSKLRISRPKATKKAKAVGLNITTGGY